MAKVESYDITGKHPEKADIERRLKEIQKDINELLVYVDKEKRFGQRVDAKKRIADLEEEDNKLRTALFRMDPTK